MGKCGSCPANSVRLLPRLFRAVLGFGHSFLLSLSCNNELYGVFPTILWAISIAIILYKLRSPQPPPALCVPPRSNQSHWCPNCLSPHSHRHVCVNRASPPPPVLVWTDRLLEDLTLFGVFVLSLKLWILTARVSKWLIDQIGCIILDITSDSSTNVAVSFLLFVQGQKDHIHSTLCWCLCIIPSNYASDQILQKLYEKYLNTPCTQNTLHKSIPMLKHVMSLEKSFEQIFNYLRCGDSVISVLPTVIFLLSAIKLICQMTYIMFRRSIFRRVPWWEGCIQDFINVVLSIHSIKTWRVYVQMLGWLVHVTANKYKYVKGYAPYFDVTIGPLLGQPYFFHQSLCWLSSLTILWITIVVCNQRDDSHHLIIWIATSPWTHTEIGSTAYYLHRPVALPSRGAESGPGPASLLRNTRSAITIRRPMSRLLARARSKSL